MSAPPQLPTLLLRGLTAHPELEPALQQAIALSAGDTDAWERLARLKDPDPKALAILTDTLLGLLAPEPDEHLDREDTYLREMHSTALYHLAANPALPLELGLRIARESDRIEALVPLSHTPALHQVLIQRLTDNTLARADQARLADMLLSRSNPDPSTAEHLLRFLAAARSDLEARLLELASISDAQGRDKSELYRIEQALSNIHLFDRVFSHAPVELLLEWAEHTDPRLAAPALSSLGARRASGAWPGPVRTTANVPGPEVLEPLLVATLDRLLVRLRSSQAQEVREIHMRLLLETSKLAPSTLLARMRAELQGLVLEHHGAPERLLHELLWPPPDELERAALASSDDPQELAALLSHAQRLTPELRANLARNPNLRDADALTLLRGLEPELMEGFLRLHPSPGFRSQALAQSELVDSLLEASLDPQEWLDLLLGTLGSELRTHLDNQRRRHSQRTSRLPRLLELLGGRFELLPLSLLLELTPADPAALAYLARTLAALGSPLEPDAAQAWSLLATLEGDFTGTLPELLALLPATLAAPRVPGPA